MESGSGVPECKDRPSEQAAPLVRHPASHADSSKFTGSDGATDWPALPGAPTNVAGDSGVYLLGAHIAGVHSVAAFLGLRVALWPVLGRPR